MLANVTKEGKSTGKFKEEVKIQPKEKKPVECEPINANPSKLESSKRPPPRRELLVSDTEDRTCDSEDDFQETKRPKINKRVKLTPVSADDGKYTSTAPVHVPKYEIEKIISPSSTNDRTTPPTTSPQSTSVLEDNANVDMESDDNLKKAAERVPKIFYATRTHQQIAQVTKELRQSAYRTTTMCILASRETTCINPLIAKEPNRNELCKEAVDSLSYGGSGCGWYSQAKRFANFDALPSYGVPFGFDLEDFVKAGRRAKACPYYASRHLMDAADLVLCPYNYLIDPTIRRMMGINIAGQIVIFDEGHNLEDASREAASCSVTQTDIRNAMQDCEMMSHKECIEPEAHNRLAALMSDISLWIDFNENNFQDMNFGSSVFVQGCTEALASLHVHGVTSERVADSFKDFLEIMSQKEEEMEMQQTRRHKRFNKITLSSPSIKTVETIFRIFDYINREEGRHREDFRISLTKTSKVKSGFKTSVAILSLWCLNPAISFNEISSVARSVTITSGTLTPVASFSSELGCNFAQKLSAQGIIPREQILGRIITKGRNGVELRGTFQNINSFGYQDDCGAIVKGICDTIPNGVLVFFPSYRAMEQLTNRWQATNVLEEISASKRIFMEPRGGGEDFLNLMRNYYEHIRATNWKKGVEGALLLAVCRGKVSEGLNFSENNARAVVCIGIPYPNSYDCQVIHKKTYNNNNTSRGLQNGDKWYTIQALRAVNQAIGRCIRHKEDFGAIYLLDSRWTSPSLLNDLPTWFKTNCSITNWTPKELQDLQHFYFVAMLPLLEKLKNKTDENCDPGFCVTQALSDSKSEDCTTTALGHF